MSEPKITKIRRSQRGIFTEIYFPRRVEAQGIIFDALKDGYNQNWVKEYLSANVKELIEELEDYWYVFTYGKKQQVRPSEKDVIACIKEYRSPFFGWSNYTVDGVFWVREEGKEEKMVEESTQVIRIMFLFESKYVAQAITEDWQDVLRAVIFWIITRQARIDERLAWDKEERDLFLEHHKPWPKNKKMLAHKYFKPVAQEIAKWLIDCLLFVFGYLVRQFSEKLIGLHKAEDEIWVTSFFNLTVSVLKKEKDEQQSPAIPQERNQS